MATLTKLGQVMHEEHFRMLMLVCGLENRISGPAEYDPIDPSDEEDLGLLRELVSGLEDVSGHNDFEESVLFPEFSDTSLGELTEILTEEHTYIGPSAFKLRCVAMTILQENGATAERWTMFRATASMFVQLMLHHLEQEELSIVQKLGVLLKPSVDNELAARFAEARRRVLASAEPS